MLSEENFLKGKSFLSVYKEALDTLRDIGTKEGHVSHSLQFYNNLDSASKRLQVKFDSNGNLLKGDNWSSSSFSQLSALSQTYVGSQVSTVRSYSEFLESLRSIKDKLELQVHLEAARRQNP